MTQDSDNLRDVVMLMKAAYKDGDNVMALARERLKSNQNKLASTLVAYDLQAGSYVKHVLRNSEDNRKWCTQLADLLSPYVKKGDSILEAGVGEATTLAGVVQSISETEIIPLGFDISWSRIKIGNEWIERNKIKAELFVGDLFHIPLADNSIDIIYTSHSLEPNGGREEEAITELMRVARKAVVLIEPIYELASEPAKRRMVEHGYVRNLRSISESLGATVAEYRLLDVSGSKLNPSGVLLLAKQDPQKNNIVDAELRWQCPLTSVPMMANSSFFFAEMSGIAFPVLQNIPLLRPEHAVVASLIMSASTEAT